MIIREVTGEETIFLVNHWLDQRGMERWGDKSACKKGWVIIDNDIPVALGYFRECEGNFLIMDGLITNPTVVGEDRNNALDFLVAEMLKFAKEKESDVLALTDEPTIIRRSLKHGFAVSPLVCLTIHNYRRE